jgi:hypothetical protein
MKKEENIIITYPWSANNAAHLFAWKLVPPMPYPKIVIPVLYR